MNCRPLITRLALVALTCAFLAGCGSANNTPGAGQNATASTSDPALLPTFQAALAQTAAWASTLTPPVAVTPTQAFSLGPISTGTPLANRTGECPVPGGYTVYERDGFCISAPTAWEVLNVDGGLAAFLNTTPGQAISIQPDWAGTTAVCHVMLFVTPEHDVAAFLWASHDQVATRTDLQTLTPVAEQPLGDIGVYGYSYTDKAGVQGSIYGALIDLNRLLYISIGGTDCALDRVLPSLETLRIN
jgi:hypothetical protein